MQGKGFKEYLEWLIVGVFILFIIGMGARLTIGQGAEIGVPLNDSNSSYTLEQDLPPVFNDTGVHTVGIFIDNDTQALFSDLTINAALTVTQTNSTTFTVDNETETSHTLGIFTQGAFADEMTARPIGNLTITSNGVINVSANGTAVLAGGIAIGNVTDNLINNGTISVFGNVTDFSGQLMVGGVYAVNATNVVNNGDVTVNGTGGYVDYAINNVPFGFEIKERLDNFTNTGNISVSIESVNATAVGVRSYDIGYFNNTGNISVFANSTSGDKPVVIGVMAGKPEEFGGYYPGQMRTFVNSGNLTVTGYASGTELYAFGVAVFNGTIDEFQNLGKIEVYGNNIGGNATVYGVGAFSYYGGYGNLTNFMNAGLINATAIGNNATSSGVHADDYIGEVTNEAGGMITVTANATDGDAEASGVNAGSIGNFTNKGDISVSSIGNTAYGLGVYGASIGNFTNEGNINAYILTSNGGIVAGLMSGIPQIFGSPEPGHISSFVNSGNLKVTGYANGTELYAFGVIVFNGTIDDFQNLGRIEVYGENTNGQAGAYGVYAENGIGNFTLESGGEISANATSTYGNATAYGISAGDVGNFTNAGTINITATATNGTAKAYGLNVGVVDTIGNFTNNGTIKVTATGKDAEATGLYAVSLTGTLLNDSSGNIQVSAQGEQSANATGIYVEKAQTGSTILNKGIIDVSAVATSGSVNSIGIYLKDSNTTLTNNGTIKVYVIYVSGNVDKVAGIYITNSTVELSNPGEVVVWGDVPSGAKIRTLYVDTGSNVTLKDKFAITFGAPGTGPNIAPIYVASGSALDLNSTTLVVRLWNNSTQYIVVNTPYSIIEYNGTVNGNWGGLEKGYINPLIDVTWYNSTITNKDAQIIFKYSALNNPEQALGPVSSITGGVIINSIMVDNVFTFLPITSPLILVKGYQPIMLASSGVSDVGAGYSLGGVEYRGGMWFKPLYTYVDADDLGFDADAYGFNIGLGGFLTKNFSLGIYANYLRAEYDYSISSAKDGDSDIFSVGIAGMWKMMKDTYLRYNVYGFSSSNDYHGRTGFNFELKEKASYNMNGVHAEILIGKVYRGKLNIIPEIGIKYTYYNPESFWTKVYDSAGNRVSSWDRYYDPDNKHMWKGLVGVMVAGETKAGGIPVNLFAYGRLEQAFGENDISALNYMRSDPTRWEISKEINRTTFIVQLGGEFMLQKNLGLEISGRGDFNGDYSGYTGKVMLRYSW